ncbi:hypothetical protein BDV93DRAFT_515676 [Ceratobasidium sp. AG-I]|nr:hypothetical protein BDV93DRAFT_515676 [Ceratobasidium sp. AG-I]
MFSDVLPLVNFLIPEQCIQSSLVVLNAKGQYFSERSSRAISSNCATLSGAATQVVSDKSPRTAKEVRYLLPKSKLYAPIKKQRRAQKITHLFLSLQQRNNIFQTQSQFEWRYYLKILSLTINLRKTAKYGASNNTNSSTWSWMYLDGELGI